MLHPQIYLQKIVSQLLCCQATGFEYQCMEDISNHLLQIRHVSPGSLGIELIVGNEIAICVPSDLQLTKDNTVKTFPPHSSVAVTTVSLLTTLQLKLGAQSSMQVVKNVHSETKPTFDVI